MSLPVNYLNNKIATKYTKKVEIIGGKQVDCFESAVEINCDRRVTTGTGWQDEFNESLFRSANFFLLIVSPDYLLSDYCRFQMKSAEWSEQTGSAKVIPIILRPVEWQPHSPWKPLPTNSQPVTNWANHDEAFADIAEGILQAIPAELQKKWVDEPCWDDIEWV